MGNELLTRNQFRESVFARDNHQCVVCKAPAKDAHHIIERRLFTDGGYYLDNGSSLCEKHHLEAESTRLSCDDIRLAAGITKIILPEHLYADYMYDKWGNIILPNGSRIKGELYYDKSVQKILDKDIEFIKYIKYPRTYHVHWSQGTKDDKVLKDDDNFKNKEVVVTLKLDGENTTMYNDYIHARSLDSKSHQTRKWVKGLWSQISYIIDDNMRICGENLYAQHTIKYDNLESYFYMFSIWINYECLSWDETVEYAEILGLKTVPVIYKGIYDKELIEKEFAKYKNHEGFVIRITNSFTYNAFKYSLAKYVNPEFRRQINNSHGHWISKKIIPNELIQKN